MTVPVQEIKPVLEEGGVTMALSQFSSLIDEFVNFGTHILKGFTEKTGGNENVPILFFFRDMLEKSDAISHLIKVSSADPAKIILRSVFETSLQIEYLLDGDSEKKALAFLVWDKHQQMNMLKRYQPGTENNKRIRKAFNADTSFSDKSFLDRLPDVSGEIRDIKEVLESELSDTTLEYLRTFKASKRPYPPQWYQLYDGPKSVKQLAEKLGKPFMYEVLYHGWSSNVHGTDIFAGKILLNDSSEDENGNVTFDVAQLNLPTSAQQVTAHLLGFMLGAYTLFINKLLPSKEDEIKKWFLGIQASFNQITQGEQLITVD